MISLLHSPFLDSITVLHRAVSRHLVFPYWAHEHIAPAHTRAALKIYAASFAVTNIINTPKLFAKCLRYLPLRARARHHKFSNWIVRHGVVSPRTTLDEATSRKSRILARCALGKQCPAPTREKTWFRRAVLVFTFGISKGLAQSCLPGPSGCFLQLPTSSYRQAFALPTPTLTLDNIDALWRTTAG